MPFSLPRRFAPLCAARSSLLLLLLLVTATTFAAGPLAGEAFGAHMRYRNVTWAKQPDGTIRFTTTVGYRCSSQFSTCPTTPGDTFFSDGVNYGDGGSGGNDFTVTATNPAEDWVVGTRTDDYDYAAAGSGTGPFTAFTGSCCTISSLNNNHDGSIQAQSLVDPTLDDESPVTSVPTIVDVGDTGVQNWSIPAFDSGGQTLTYRLGTADESCGGCFDPQPPGLAMDPTTGQISWDTTGQSLGLWFTSAVVEAHDALGTIVSSTEVTYLVRVSARGANAAPAWGTPTPDDATQFNTNAGTPVTFDVAASDANSEDTVHIDSLGLPTGASLTTSDANPASGTFTWTPTAGQAGDYLITVTAQDSNSPPAGAPSRTFRIHVDALPTPSLSTTATSATLGDPIDDTATLADGASPTGTITFDLYGPGDPTCSGTPEFTSTVAVDAGNGDYASETYTPTTAGTHRWVASYSGDVANTTAAGACGDPGESSSVKTTTSIVSGASPTAAAGDAINDSAVVNATFSVTGTLTFDLYGPDDASCASPPVFTSTVPVAGFITTGGAYQDTLAGTYRWIASYSGDETHYASTGACNDAGETSVVSKATPYFVTSAGSGNAGGTIGDTAFITGADPSGSITFNLFGQDDPACTGTPLSTTTKQVDTGDGAYPSDPVTVTGAGTYHWVASYSGDANNTAVSGACGDAGETSTVAKASTSIFTNADDGAAGDPISDTATIAGGAGATGTITFDLYGPGDTACASPPLSTTTTNVSGNGAYSSDAVTAADAGTYQWIASYSGDANNAPAAGTCGEAGETSTVAKASPSMTATAMDGEVGGSISDTATITGGLGASGTITFDLYGPGDTACTGTPVFTNVVQVSGDGDYASGPFMPTAPGEYRWVVSYSGDGNNAAVTGACNDPGQTSTVSQAAPALSTTASDGAVGGSVSDTATLSDGVGATGTITFSLYGPADASCSDTPVFTTTKAVDGNDDYVSASYTPTAPGSHHWIASYAGDANNAPAAGACGDAGETSAVAKAPAGLSTTAADGAVGGTVSDTATLTGGVGARGTITFAVYGPDDATCTGTPLDTSTQAVDGNGDYESAALAPAAPGAYHWIASYDGDANNASAAGTCGDAGETSTIAKDSPAIATTATDSSVGGSIHDAATLSAGTAPTGTVTFDLYGPGDTTCDDAPVFTTTAAVDEGNSSYDSPPYTPADPGNHRWVASYGGDANNAPVTGACGDAGETSAVVKATPELSTSATGAAVGRAIHDTATVTGPGSPTGAMTFTVYGPDDATCATAGTPVAGGTLSDGEVRSANFISPQPGTYRWIAHYPGDADNEAVDGACNDAGESSTVGDPRIAVSEGGPAQAHAGDTVTFTFAVANPGAEPVHAVTVSDEKCSAFSSTIDKTQSGGAADGSPGTLNPGDTWTYTCTMAMPEGTSLQDVATAGASDANEDAVPSASASHTTRIIHPEVVLAESGPETATAGASVAYTLAVTNPGDVRLPADSVKVTDELCSEAPKLTVKQTGGADDASPESLNPGDRWTYGCSVQSHAGDTQIVNSAAAAAADELGKIVTAKANATTALTPGAVPRAGTSAYLTVPAKCVTKRFRLDVKGTSIASVQYAIDGKKYAVMTKPDAAGMWSLSIDPMLRSGARHTVTAVVTYTTASGTVAKTLSTTFKRCACVSRRAFPISLRNQFHTALRSASVYINGKRVRVLRTADELKAPIRLVGLPKGRVVVRINAVTIKGKHVSATRAYLTCAKEGTASVPNL